MSYPVKGPALLRAICAILLSVPVLAENWPNFHGPKCDNISPDKGLLKSWPEKGPELLWKYEGIGSGFSTVSIVNGVIYTAGCTDKNTMVYALNPSGKLLWQSELGDPLTETKLIPGTRGTPTVKDGKVYTLSPLGVLGCFSAKDGAKLWEKGLADSKMGVRTPGWRFSESFLIDGNRIFVTVAKKDFINAYDKDTGKKIWSTSGFTDALAYCSPAVIEFNGIRQLVTMSARYVVSFDIESGKMLWSAKQESLGMNVATPVIDGNRVYVSSSYKCGTKCLELSADGSGIAVKEAWSSGLLDSVLGAVVLVNGKYYGGDNYSSLRGFTCLDAKTGEEPATAAYLTTQFETARRIGSITYADGMLYYLRNDGMLYLINGDCKIISKFKLPPDSNTPCWAHPVVLDGRLYVRHDKTLYVYDVKNGKSF